MMMARIKKLRIPIAPLLVLVAISLCVPPTFATNLIVNGNLENTTNASVSYAWENDPAFSAIYPNYQFQNDPLYVINGSYSLMLKRIGLTNADIWRTIKLSDVGISSLDGAHLELTATFNTTNSSSAVTTLYIYTSPDNSTYTFLDYLDTAGLGIAQIVKTKTIAAVPYGTQYFRVRLTLITDPSAGEYSSVIDDISLATNGTSSIESSLWAVRSFPSNRPNAIDYGTYVLYNRTFSGVNKYCLWGDQFCLLYLLNATYRTIGHIEDTFTPPQICLSGTTLCTNERMDYFTELGTTKKYEEGGFVLFYNGAIYSRPYSEYIDRLVYTKVRADTNTCYFWNSFTATNRGLSIPSTNSVYWGLSPDVIGSNQAFLYSPLGFECFNPTNLTITLEFWDPHTAVHLFDKNVSVPVGYKLGADGLPDYTQPLDCALNATLCGGGSAGGGGGGGTGATDIDKIINAFFQPKNIVLITFIGLSVAAAGIGGAFLGLIAFGGFMMIGLMMGVVDFWIALLLVIMDGLGLAALLSKIF